MPWQIPIFAILLALTFILAAMIRRYDRTAQEAADNGLRTFSKRMQTYANLARVLLVPVILSLLYTAASLMLLLWVRQ